MLTIPDPLQLREVKITEKARHMPRRIFECYFGADNVLNFMDDEVERYGWMWEHISGRSTAFQYAKTVFLNKEYFSVTFVHVYGGNTTKIVACMDYEVSDMFETKEERDAHVLKLNKEAKREIEIDKRDRWQLKLTARRKTSEPAGYGKKFNVGDIVRIKKTGDREFHTDQLAIITNPISFCSIEVYFGNWCFFQSGKYWDSDIEMIEENSTLARFEELCTKEAGKELVPY